MFRLKTSYEYFVDFLLERIKGSELDSIQNLKAIPQKH